MKQIWLFSVRAYLRLALFFYFKKIEIQHINRVPKNEAVIFLGNHQNALLDALLIATKNGRFSYFLTRASVFNKPLVSKILQSLQMLPVYRIRDGWGNLNKNNAVFSKTSKLLSERNAVVIFPEGSHHLNRTVRPLSKGFTRIIFETLERYPKTEIKLIPVGLNFKHAEKFSDTALIHFGKPITVGLELLEDKAQSVLKLKEEVSQQLKELTIHIENDNYELTLQQLKDLNVDFTKPETVNQCIANNFKDCKQAKPKLVHPIKQIAKVLLILNLFAPYLIWKKIAEPKIKEIEFTSTFRFAIVISLVPIFIILVMIILALLLSIKFAFLYVIAVIILALLSVKL
ncbi:lysophospholipid acyltransferase family protein [Psychroserpens damuponensis]|uniref:lysophospholipid acyltransferase family protein n=1 Tax=Psychroserpens damuponensis TaxID=943936 RepID=UPI00058B2183|nr:lysophospholipid acyltransferase family protein [Psychroserpens damuponensis]